MFELQHRPNLAELMDQPNVEPDTLASNLGDLRILNAILGWRRGVVETVAAIVASDGLSRVRLLDVATGSGDIPSALNSWARRQGLDMELIASDMHPLTVRVAQERQSRTEIRVVQHDAALVPFRSSSFDIAMCNLALHHFPPDEAVAVLRELARVGRHVIVSDLVRSRPAFLSAHIMGGILRHQLTSHDGPVSVQRAYTVPELASLADRAGLTATVRPVFPFRMTLVGARREVSR